MMLVTTEESRQHMKRERAAWRCLVIPSMLTIIIVSTVIQRY